jgi:hypothetical protein
MQVEIDRLVGHDLRSVSRLRGAFSARLTVREYRALTRWRRTLYRLPRHPLIANPLLPPLVFVVLYRLPLNTPRTWKRERRSVWLTNARNCRDVRHPCPAAGLARGPARAPADHGGGLDRGRVDVLAAASL